MDPAKLDVETGDTSVKEVPQDVDSIGALLTSANEIIRVVLSNCSGLQKYLEHLFSRLQIYSFMHIQNKRTSTS